MNAPTADTLRDQAYRCYQAGKIVDAQSLCRRLLKQVPGHAEATYLLAVIAKDAGHVERAMELFAQAALAAPNNAVIINAQAEALLEQGQIDQALACLRQAIEVAPGYARAHNNLGRIFQMQGNMEAAQASFTKAIDLDPQYPIAHNNLGCILLGRGQLTQAEAHFRQALSEQPNYPEAHFNLGATLRALGQLRAGAAHLQRAIGLRPGYGRAYALLGQICVDLGQLAGAVEPLQKAVQLQPGEADHHFQLGSVLMLLDRPDQAGRAFDEALRLRPQFPDCFARRCRLRAEMCDWSDRPGEVQRLWDDTAAAIAANQRTPIHPLYSLALPWSGEQLLAVARSYALAYAQEPRTPPAVPAGSSTPRIRIGYLSREFYDHAIAHQIQGLFALHDRDAFEIHAYSLGPDDGSSYRRKIQHDCECFHDVADLTLTALEAKIRADGIDILVDLMGYTGIGRTACLACRPAPIQVQWMGFPGTMGAPFIDYLMGDAIVTPPEHAANYSERCVRLPGSFMMTDHQQPIAATLPSRRECGLPPQGVVFCCFNNAYKIEPRIFDLWMRILKQVPASVLWLSVRQSAAQANLRREAQSRGIPPTRLVFAAHLPSKADHLARHRLADLFLDTHDYNAHATGCDALWAGLPLLSCPGQTFASRVGASLLSAAGLPELIATDLPHYQQLAIDLANHPEALAALRQKLAAQRLSCVLFDTPAFVRNLEQAYRTMWEQHLRTPPGTGQDTIG